MGKDGNDIVENFSLVDTVGFTGPFGNMGNLKKVTNPKSWSQARVYYDLTRKDGSGGYDLGYAHEVFKYLLLQDVLRRECGELPRGRSSVSGLFYPTRVRNEDTMLLRAMPGTVPIAWLPRVKITQQTNKLQINGDTWTVPVVAAMLLGERMEDLSLCVQYPEVKEVLLLKQVGREYAICDQEGNCFDISTLAQSPCNLIVLPKHTGQDKDNDTNKKKSPLCFYIDALRGLGLNVQFLEKLRIVPTEGALGQLICALSKLWKQLSEEQITVSILACSTIQEVLLQMDCKKQADELFQSPIRLEALHELFCKARFTVCNTLNSLHMFALLCGADNKGMSTQEWTDILVDGGGLTAKMAKARICAPKPASGDAQSASSSSGKKKKGNKKEEIKTVRLQQWLGASSEKIRKSATMCIFNLCIQESASKTQSFKKIIQGYSIMDVNFVAQALRSRFRLPENFEMLPFSEVADVIKEQMTVLSEIVFKGHFLMIMCSVYLRQCYLVSTVAIELEPLLTLIIRGLPEATKTTLLELLALSEEQCPQLVNVLIAKLLDSISIPGIQEGTRLRMQEAGDFSIEEEGLFCSDEVLGSTEREIQKIQIDMQNAMTGAEKHTGDARMLYVLRALSHKLSVLRIPANLRGIVGAYESTLAIREDGRSGDGATYQLHTMVHLKALQQKIDPSQVRGRQRTWLRLIVGKAQAVSEEAGQEAQKWLAQFDEVARISYKKLTFFLVRCLETLVQVYSVLTEARRARTLPLIPDTDLAKLEKMYNHCLLLHMSHLVFEIRLSQKQLSGKVSSASSGNEEDDLCHVVIAQQTTGAPEDDSLCEQIINTLENKMDVVEAFRGLFQFDQSKASPPAIKRWDPCDIKISIMDEEGYTPEKMIGILLRRCYRKALEFRLVGSQRCTQDEFDRIVRSLNSTSTSVIIEKESTVTRQTTGAAPGTTNPPSSCLNQAAPPTVIVVQGGGFQPPYYPAPYYNSMPQYQACDASTLPPTPVLQNVAASQLSGAAQALFATMGSGGNGQQAYGQPGGVVLTAQPAAARHFYQQQQLLGHPNTQYQQVQGGSGERLSGAAQALFATMGSGENGQQAYGQPGGVVVTQPLYQPPTGGAGYVAQSIDSAQNVNPMHYMASYNLS